MSFFPHDICDYTAQVIAICAQKKLTLTTAESCTGGLIAALLTSIPGVSQVFTHGFVTYANDAKILLAHVPPALLEAHGAVSEEVARAMAEGARDAAGSSMAISVTGIAGPGGGSPQKPVGLVHMACARAGYATLHAKHIFTGERDDVRLQSVRAAIALIETAASA